MTRFSYAYVFHFLEQVRRVGLYCERDIRSRKAVDSANLLPGKNFLFSGV